MNLFYTQEKFALMKMSWRRVQDVLIKTNLFALVICLQDIFKMSWSRPIYLSWSSVFKISSRCFQDVLKTSSRRLAKASSSYIKDVFKTYSKRFQNVLQKRLQDDFKRYQQVKLFLLTRLRDVFNTFLWFTVKATEKLIVYLQNLEGWKEFLKY